MKLAEVHESSNSLYLICEYLKGGSLSDFLCKQTSFLPDKAVVTIVLGLLAAIDAMHHSGVVHRDLKPENIMLARDCSAEELKVEDIRVVDFGLATKIDGEYLYQRCGTPGYVAPEVVVADEKDKAFKLTSKVDVFSTGVILYSLLTGLLPFDDKNPKEALEKTVRGVVDYSHPALVNKSKNLISLLKGLLDSKPKDRLSAVQAIKLPIFDDLRGQSKIISLELEESDDSIAEESEIPYNMSEYDYSIKSLDKRSVFRSGQGISDKDSVCFSSSPSKNSINSLHQKSLQR